MRELILYLVTFIIAYLFYIVFVLCRKNVLKKFPNGKEITYLKYKYDIKVNDKNLKKVANTIFLANSFILATTVYVVCLFDNFFIELIVGILTLVILILGVYHLIGTYYKKKQGGKKNV
ncbi:MAG: hypothetical protein IKL65_04485 [Bacilli bacterium]|nr:hypothetical protein [Bacilli bacterium]